MRTHWLTWAAANPPSSEGMSPQPGAHSRKGRHRNRKKSPTWMNRPCFLRRSGRPARLLVAHPPPPTPRRQGVTPLLEVEDCTPASKRPRHSPGCTGPASGWRSRAVSRSPRQTPMRDVRQELFPSSAHPPSPGSCDETWLAPRSPATASTITCSTEGSRCGTPDPSRPLFGTPNTP